MTLATRVHARAAIATACLMLTPAAGWASCGIGYDHQVRDALSERFHTIKLIAGDVSTAKADIELLPKFRLWALTIEDSCQRAAAMGWLDFIERTANSTIALSDAPPLPELPK